MKTAENYRIFSGFAWFSDLGNMTSAFRYRFQAARQRMRDPSLSDWQPARAKPSGIRTFSAVIHLLCDALKTPPPVWREPSYGHFSPAEFCPERTLKPFGGTLRVKARPEESDQQPEASLAWCTGNLHCEA